MSSPSALTAPGTYISEISGGRKVSVTPGTAVQLSSVETACQGVIVQALRSNSGNVTVSGSDAKATLGQEKGVQLLPGQTITIFAKSVNLVWIDVDNTGEGVQYLTLKG